MGKSHLVFRWLLITGAAVAMTALGSASASAAPASTPAVTSSCKVPALTLSSTTAIPGTKITVSGKNFSGCTAAGSTAKPTGVLTVRVGVLTAANVQDLLATTKTAAVGSFTVQIIVPAVPAGGKPYIVVAAISEDPATKLVYHATQIVKYTIAHTDPAERTTTSPSSTTHISSSVDMPTAVPAGSGGMGASSSPARMEIELGFGIAGIVLLGVSGLTLTRRRVRKH